MRKLMIVSLSFAAATALAHYLLPLSLLPLSAGLSLAAFLLLLPWRRRLTARLFLITAALAVSFLYNYAYRAHITGQVDRKSVV